MTCPNVILIYPQRFSGCKIITMSYIVSSVGPLVKPFITTWSQHMIKEAEILDPTGVMYVQHNPHRHFGSVLAESMNVYNPAFSHTATGEDTRFTSQEQIEV